MASGYEAFVSLDGKKWRDVSDGEFGNLRANPVEQSIRFAPKKAKFLKIKATKAIEGAPVLKKSQIHPVAK